MTTYVYRDGKLVEKHLAPPREGAPYVISDIMPALQHMADGKMYDSKAKFRAATKAAGCLEYGNETGTLLKPRAPIQLDCRQRREDIKRSLYEARNK